MEVAVEEKSRPGTSVIADKIKFQKKAVVDSPSPYLLERREWDERHGDLTPRARHWRRAAISCAREARQDNSSRIDGNDSRSTRRNQIARSMERRFHHRDQSTER